MNLRRWTLAALTLVSVGCGSEDKFNSQTSNDISIDPTGTIVFSRVRPGRPPSEEAIIIRSAGEQPLTIKAVYLEGDLRECDRVTQALGPFDAFPGPLAQTCTFAISERPEFPITVAPNDFEEVKLQFLASSRPDVTGGRLVVESDNITNPRLFVDLSVASDSPRIAASPPPPVVFLPATPGQQALLIKNTGSGTLEVAEPTFRYLTEQPRDPNTGEVVSELFIDYDTELPWAIAEGGSENVLLRYDPKDDLPDTAELVFTSNDVENPTFVVRVTTGRVFGTLNVDPNPVVAVIEGTDEVNIPITFTNTGTRQISIFEMTVQQNGTDYALKPEIGSFALAAGRSNQTYQIKYRPTTGTGSDATLLISTDADNAVKAPDARQEEPGIIEVPLVRDAMSLPGLITLDPTAIDFSDVALGMSREATVTLRNGGGQALEVTRIALSADGDAASVPATDAEFTLVAGGGATSVAPGGSHAVRVAFARGAEDRNDHFGALVIESNATGSPHVVYFTSSPPAN